VKQKRIGKLIVFVALIAAALTVGVRGMVRGWELQRRLACAEQMKRIGEALKIYGSDLPASEAARLEWLVDRGAVHAEDMTCPSGHEPNYHLRNRDDVVLVEPLSNHAEGANVLFADGHVSFVPAAHYTHTVSPSK
jgi:prepilin-type processing-associated H-X9-DG protein